MGEKHTMFTSRHRTRQEYIGSGSPKEGSSSTSISIEIGLTVGKKRDSIRKDTFRFSRLFDELVLISRFIKQKQFTLFS